MRTVAATFVLIACMSIDVNAQGGGKAPGGHADEVRTTEVELQRPALNPETEDDTRRDRVINWRRSEERATTRSEERFEGVNRGPGIRDR